MATASTIYTDAAPKPVGPYSQAIAIGDLIFTAGQIALDPATNTLIEGGVVVQTRLVLSNLAAVLEAGGSSLAKVVKTTVFLVDMNDFAAMNTVYSEFFGTTAPARSCVEAARLPKDVRVEIEAIAYR